MPYLNHYNNQLLSLQVAYQPVIAHSHPVLPGLHQLLHRSVFGARVPFQRFQDSYCHRAIDVIQIRPRPRREREALQSPSSLLTSSKLSSLLLRIITGMA